VQRTTSVASVYELDGDFATSPMIPDNVVVKIVIKISGGDNLFAKA
jgi:hypothetical protein